MTGKKVYYHSSEDQKTLKRTYETEHLFKNHRLNMFLLHTADVQTTQNCKQELIIHKKISMGRVMTAYVMEMKLHLFFTQSP